MTKAARPRFLPLLAAGALSAALVAQPNEPSPKPPAQRTPAKAKPAPKTTSKGPAKAAADPALPLTPPPLPDGVTLVPDPVRLEALGLTIRPPLGGLAQSTSVGTARQSLVIRPPDSAWAMEISDRITRDKALTPGALADDLLRDLMKSRERGVRDDKGAIKVTGSAVELIDRKPSVLIGGAPASVFYVATSTADSNRIVTGYAVARSEPGRFVICMLTCLPGELDKARAIYENVLASIEFRNALDAAADRAAGARAGADLLASLTREDYEAMLPRTPQYYRLYRVAPGGTPADATEVAYQLVDIRAGMRGELDPRKPKDSFKASDRDPGFIARVVARYVEGERTIDTEATFFATLAGGEADEEVWTNRMLIRDKKDTSTWTQKGARVGNRLTVQTQGAGASDAEKQWLTPDKAFLSQVQVHLLPRMLARAAKPLIFGFYAFNSGSGAQSGDVTLRRETLEPAPGGEGWVLRTRVGEGVAERATTLAADGSILRVETSDGLVMEPIDADSLQRLWRSKGLPTN